MEILKGAELKFYVDLIKPVRAIPLTWILLLLLQLQTSLLHICDILISDENSIKPTPPFHLNPSMIFSDGMDSRAFHVASW